MKYFASLILWLSCCSALTAQTVLEYALKKNEVFTVKQSAEQIITQELDGAAHKITNNIKGVLEFKVLAERDNIYEIAVTFKDLNLKIQSSIQGELMNVSAKVDDENNMQAKIFKSLLNSPITITLAKTGKIIEVSGGDTLVSKMAKASGLEDEFSLNMMKNSLQKEFGSEALSDSYEQMTFIYPKKPLNIGDSWKNKYTGKLSAHNLWTLEALSNEEGRISGTAKIVMDITEPATTMKLSGSQQTKITFDPSSGFINKTTVEGASKGFSTMTQMGDKKIPTTILSTITYEIVDSPSE